MEPDDDRDTAEQQQWENEYAQWCEEQEIDDFNEEFENARDDN